MLWIGLAFHLNQEKQNNKQLKSFNSNLSKLKSFEMIMF